MDPLEYFEEEYSNFNESISEVGSLILQSRDIYVSFLETQKQLASILQSKNHDLTELNQLLTNFEVLIKDSKSFIDTAEKSLNALQKQRV
jgi:uncharacterized damage-inducible protein DinB